MSHQAVHRFRHLQFCLTAVVSLTCGSAIAAGADQTVTGDQLTQQLDHQNGEFGQLLTKYCFECHGDGFDEGGVLLDEDLTWEDIQNNAPLWQTAKAVIEDQYMPPPNAWHGQPTSDERDAMTRYIDQVLDFVDCSGPADPGRVTIHRLNRTEYLNTVRDLMGVDLSQQLLEVLPRDEVGYGFDNIADVLTVSPLLMEKYLAAAEMIVNAAIDGREPIVEKRIDVSPASMTLSGSANVYLETVSFYSRGRIAKTFGLNHLEHRTESYQLLIDAYGDQAGDDPAKMAVWVATEWNEDQKNNSQQGWALRRVAVVEVPNDGQSSKQYTVDLQLPAGDVRLAVGFINDFYRPKTLDQSALDRNLYIETFSLIGPINPQRRDRRESHELLIPSITEQQLLTESTIDEHDEMARRVIASFLERAFRRPIQANELDRYVNLYHQQVALSESTMAPVEALKTVLTAALVSPHFLYRMVQHPEPDNPDRIVRLQDHELASRLSYFLWSTMPDEELLAADLSTNEAVWGHADAMLRDGRAEAFVRNFVGQWLKLRNLEDHVPDAALYPDFDEALKWAMQREAELFLADLVSRNGSILSLIDADYTFVNARLAKHYGLATTGLGNELQRVEFKSPTSTESTLANFRGGGVVTMAGVLTVSSHATRTSPVLRGAYVLDQLLGMPPPPPPPDAGVLPEAEAHGGASLRDRLALHRAAPGCASCHNRLDPLGFALEHYDATGAWRDTEGEFTIDATGQLPGGEPFEGAAGLRDVLLKEKRAFTENFIEKMMIFALGRGLERYDQCTVQAIADRAERDDYAIRSIIEGIVTSPAFVSHRGRE